MALKRRQGPAIALGGGKAVWETPGHFLETLHGQRAAATAIAAFLQGSDAA